MAGLLPFNYLLVVIFQLEYILYGVLTFYRYSIVWARFKMSADEDTELRDLVAQTLETNGVLGKIRVKIHTAYHYYLTECCINSNGWVKSIKQHWLLLRHVQYNRTGDLNTVA